MVKRGTGGTVKFGYRVVAQVGAWTYRPEPPHSGAPPGSGVVDVRLTNVQAMYLSQEDQFDLRVREGNMVWLFENASYISDECFTVTASPKPERA